MDSGDLLAREEEFRRLNKQLEKKTVSLMQEIENVMHKQDIFAEFSHSLNFPQNHIRKSNTCEVNKITPHNTSVKQNNSYKISPDHNIKEKSSKLTRKLSQNAESHEEIHNKNTKSDHVHDKITQNEELECEETKNEESRHMIICDCFRNRKDHLYVVNDDIQFVHAFVTVNVQDKVLPQTFLKERYNVESVCKFLSSKIKLMQEQIDTLQSVMNKKSAQCEVHLAQLAEMEGEKLKLLNQVNNYRADATEYKNRCASLHTKLNEKERQYKEQRSEADKLSSEVKRLRSRNATIEAKCANQDDEISRVKQQMEAMKHIEKEFRDSSRSHSATQNSAISRQEGKIKQLTNTIEKLYQLYDNLKKQNAILSAEVLLQGLEKEYCRLLIGDD